MIISAFLILTLISYSGNNDSGSNHDTTSSGGTIPPSDVSFWLTKGDQTVLLQQQNVPLSFGTSTNNSPFIDVDSTQTFQTIYGFGFTLTGGSAHVISQMDVNSKASLLNELFGNGSSSIGISYLRLSIGASDLNESVFSYDDMPSGQSDTSLAHFSLAADTNELVPLLQQIVAISPPIKIIAAPWSAPVWMKNNGSTAEEVCRQLTTMLMRNTL